MYELRTKVADDDTITVAALRDGNVAGFLLGRMVDGVPVILSDNLPTDARREGTLILRLLMQPGKQSETDNNRVQNIMDNEADEEFHYYG